MRTGAPLERIIREIRRRTGGRCTARPRRASNAGAPTAQTGHTGRMTRTAAIQTEVRRILKTIGSAPSDALANLDTSSYHPQDSRFGRGRQEAHVIGEYHGRDT